MFKKEKPLKIFILNFVKSVISSPKKIKFTSGHVNLRIDYTLIKKIHASFNVDKSISSGPDLPILVFALSMGNLELNPHCIALNSKSTDNFLLSINKYENCKCNFQC